MAVLKAYAVLDSKVGAYMRPFFMQSKGQATRSWIDIANDPTSEIGKHPEDYTLFEIAEYDDTSACFENHPSPISLGVAKEFVRMEDQKPKH